MYMAQYITLHAFFTHAYTDWSQWKGCSTNIQESMEKPC